MTTTRIYRSTDAGAPVLVGGVSSLINLLDKCLVTGYGSKTAAGWTKPYTGTDTAVFRNSVAAGGSGMHIRVLDDGSGSGGAREALVRAYLTMSDVDTGTVETPEVAQLAGSIVWRKSNTVDSTPRAWFMVADERTLYLCVSDGFAHVICAAGDYESYVPGDAYPFFIGGRSAQAGASSYPTFSYSLVYKAGSWATPTAAGLYLARGYAGTGAPVACAIPLLATTVGGAGSAIGGGSGLIASPAPGSGLDSWYPAFIASESTMRGRFRGLYVPLTNFSGIAAGVEYASPPGLPSGAVLVTLRHVASGTGGDDGHVFVDSVTSWG